MATRAPFPLAVLGLLLAAQSPAVTPVNLVPQDSNVDPHWPVVAAADPTVDSTVAGSDDAQARQWHAYFRKHLRYSHAYLTPWHAVPHEPAVRVD